MNHPIHITLSFPLHNSKSIQFQAFEDILNTFIQTVDFPTSKKEKNPKLYYHRYIVRAFLYSKRENPSKIYSFTSPAHAYIQSQHTNLKIDARNATNWISIYHLSILLFIPKLSSTNLTQWK